MAETRVSIAIADTSNGPPAGRAFAETILHFVEILEAMERPLGKRLQPTRWVIHDLHHSVPTVEVAPEIETKHAVEAIHSTMRDISALKGQILTKDIPGSRGQALAKFQQSLLDGHLSVALASGQMHAELSSDDLAELPPGDETREIGVVEGSLEAINIHQRHLCSIYEPITGRRVTGEFEPELAPKLGRLIGKRIRVTGEITYKNHVPSKVRIWQLSEARSQGHVRDISELQGIGKTWFGSKPSEDYIRELWDDD